ncbi:hypothetical protein [Couchioplanes caeruleus]|uniref:Uncharacterized protein n=2 Tax=Couchioplanes caeruleus TaxID=56438 RepID=A0A1K0G2Z1_9ACTN|nr:hypothetical protein [Couchioplanes caeruleus]OJF11658.1 hypothetical protein BG844_24960 [Couchioplanes caeruleus subsp. caeruleus]
MRRGRAAMRKCPRCGHPTRADRMVKGFGRDCAAQLGLVGRTVDTGHSGPDLLDLLGPGDPSGHEGDRCDGWDRPADRA